MQTWKLNIEIKVANSWIKDGFDLAERLDEIQESLTGLLPYAYENELRVTVSITKVPSKEVIRKLQAGE